MKIILIIVLVLLISDSTFADSTTVNRRLADIEHSVKLIDANQLNYKIEKDLLKETYSNNYEKINLVITLILGVMGVLGYLGLKDISTIKKEYEAELNRLREVQGQFNVKLQEIDVDKKKIDDELRSIIKENEEQSRKIKFIELKDKVRVLLKENSLTPALEFANIALQITNDDNELLNQKGRILCRLNQPKDAIDSFNIALKTNPTDSATILNTVECLYFAKDIEAAKKIIEENKSLFESKENGNLLELFKIIDLFHQDKKADLIEIAKSYVEYKNLESTVKKMNTWDLKEAEYFVHYQQNGELKTLIQNIIWYWDGQITGRDLLTRLSIDLPINPDDPK